MAQRPGEARPPRAYRSVLAWCFNSFKTKWTYMDLMHVSAVVLGFLQSTSFSCSSTCLWRCVMNECQSIRSPPVSDLIKSKLKKVQNKRGRLRITSGKQLFGTTILAYTSPTANILDLPAQSVPLGLTCSQYIAKIPSLGQWFVRRWPERPRSMISIWISPEGVLIVDSMTSHLDDRSFLSFPSSIILHCYTYCTVYYCFVAMWRHSP